MAVFTAASEISAQSLGITNQSTAGPFLFDHNESSLLQPSSTTRENFISDSAVQLVQTVVNGVVLPVLVPLGVTGNVINMVVFCRQGLRDRINVCLFSLAFSDIGFILSYWASRLYDFFYLFDKEIGNFWKAHWYYYLGVYHAFLTASSSLTVLISFERCLCVISPLRAKTMLSTRTMLMIILTILVVSCGGKLIGSFKYAPHTVADPSTNETHVVIGPSEFYVNNRRVFHQVFDITFNTVIPVTSLVFVIAFTTVIAVRMRSVAAWRKENANVSTSQQGSSGTQREAAVTRTLLMVCVVYTVCVTPNVVHALARYFVRDFVIDSRLGNVYNVTLVIVHLMETINCSVNVIIYVTLSTRYRETLAAMCGRRRTKENSEGETKMSVFSTSRGSP